MGKGQEGTKSKKWSEVLGPKRDIWEKDQEKKGKKPSECSELVLINPSLHSVSLCWHGLKGHGKGSTWQCACDLRHCLNITNWKCDTWISSFESGWVWFFVELVNDRIQCRMFKVNQ